MLAVLRQMPGNYLIVKADVPDFTIVEVSEGYATTTGFGREVLIGKGLFKAFPDNSEGTYVSEIDKLRTSLLTVVETKKRHEMPMIRYDLKASDGGELQERYWMPLNQPVIVGTEVVYIIHQVEDMTENANLKRSEHYFRELANETPFMIWKSTAGRCSYVNSAWIDFTGLSLKENLNQGFMQVFHPDDLPKEREQLALAAVEGRTYESKLRVRRKDGEYRWVLARASPHLLDNGTIECFGNMVDITERELAARILQENEEKLFNILNSISQITWTNANDGTVTFYNKQSLMYTGKTEHEGKDWKSIVHPDDLPSTSRHFYEIIKSGKAGEFESRYKHVSGVYHWFLNHLTPMKNDAGMIERWVGTATDIHELKLLQQQKEDFISIASHELKTPITSLKVSLQLLDRIKDTTTSALIPSLIAQANKGLEKVSVLIEDLLDIGKFDHSKVSLNRAFFIVAELIEECLQHLKIEGIYKIKIDGDLQTTAYADKAKIEQVILNLVNNAIKYAPSSKEILITILHTEEQVKVSVRDYGDGIASDKLPYIFDRYYRAGHQDDQISGLGLGLFISAEIIKRHGGSIGVESKLGSGTTFYFTIPVK